MDGRTADKIMNGCFDSLAPSMDPDRPKTVDILRSGMRLPVGDAVAWRALSE